MLTRASSPVAGLYVHVPFCAHKCAYCAFYSEPTQGQLMDRYVRALVRELELVASDLQPATVFFGGGTPSLLNLSQWQTVLQAMERLGLTGANEWTIECNPATVSLDKARLWRDYGVNRVSMGVQSLDEGLLDRLGRIHSRQMVFKSFDLLRKGGFANINIDLMFAIPGQTLDVWQTTLVEAISLGSEHLSSYELTYEEDTPLYQQLEAGEFSVDEALACGMYEELVERSATGGFIQYEVSNFARHEVGSAGCPSIDIAGNRGAAREFTGARLSSAAARANARSAGESGASHAARRAAAGESRAPLVAALPRSAPPRKKAGRDNFLPVPSQACRHNINYWRGGSYYGLGPSAAGYVRGVRTRNWSNTQLYCEQLEKGVRAIESHDPLPPLRRAGEIAAFGLRMNAGWPFDLFQEATGFDLRADWAPEMESLVRRGWARIEPGHFGLTDLGLRFADAAGEEFLR